MKVWITKYALTSGIFVEDGCHVVINHSGCISVKKSIRHGGTVFYHDRDWHADRDSAIKRAYEMLERKRISLNKQLDKLRKLDFYKTTPE